MVTSTWPWMLPAYPQLCADSWLAVCLPACLPAYLPALPLVCLPEYPPACRHACLPDFQSARLQVLDNVDHCFCVMLNARGGAAFPPEDTVEKEGPDGKKRVFVRGTSSEARALGEAEEGVPMVRAEGTGRAGEKVRGYWGGKREGGKRKSGYGGGGWGEEERVEGRDGWEGARKGA